MKKINKLCYLIMPLLVLKIVTPTWAQSDEELTLNLRRNFGFSSGTGIIQGTFTMKVTGPETLNRVVFLIDDEVMGEVSAAPYSVKFQTNTYSPGVHSLTAIGYTHDGSELRSNEIRVEFVSAEEGWSAAVKILIPILGIILGGMVLSYLISTVISRRTKSDTPLGAPRNYGIWGGAVCPKCGRPFGRHIWGLNLGAGKFDRCPHCGKWSPVRRASPKELRIAEAAELAISSERDQIPTLSDEDRLRKELEDSRYQDL